MKTKRYLIASVVIIVVCLIAGGAWFAYRNWEKKEIPQVQENKQKGLTQEEKQKIIDELKKVEKPITEKEKTQIVNELKKTLQPLSDTEKQKIIQDLQTINK